MHIDTLLLILESVLLVATVILLVVSLREGRARDSLIMELGKAVRVLTRHEYFLTVFDAMIDAKTEVVACITGRQPAGDDTKRTKEVVNIVEKLVKEGVSVSYLLPKFQDRLHVGWLYSQAGAEVRYSGCPLVEDFRYTVVDRRAALIGIPESTGEKEATKKGYRIPSEGLAAILREHFTNCFEDSITYDEYLKYTIEHTGSSVRMLSRELKVDEAELERVSGG